MTSRNKYFPGRKKMKCKGGNFDFSRKKQPLWPERSEP